MAKKVDIQTAPNLISTPDVYFKKNEFEAAIWKQGYDIIIEKALVCPCKSKQAGFMSNCRNCGGTGWLFINPVKTKAILHSQNQSTQYKEWTQANLGNVNITVRDIDRIAFMDRITVEHAESLYSQVVHPVIYKNKLFAFLDYNVKEVTECFMFNESNKPLLLLEEGEDFTIEDGKIILNDKYIPVKNLTLSMRYIHAPQYHIIDIKRDVMVSTTFQVGVGKETSQMPVSAVGRRAHYVLDRQNFNGNYIIDNSYEKDVCKLKNTQC